MDEPVVLYRYGGIAWVWRLLGAVALLAAAALAVLAWRERAWGLLGVALPLALPVLVLMPMVATRVQRLPDGRLQVDTLAFLRRRLDPARLGPPRHRDAAYTDTGAVHAPRAWVPVRGSLFPVYLDLLATLPDRAGFVRAFSLDERRVPR